MNKVELEGALVRDPEMRFLPSGTGVCEFSLVLNDTKYDKDKKETVATATFVTCQLWGALGEKFADEFRKGDRVYVMGKLTRQVIEKDDGKKDEKTRVAVLFAMPTFQRNVHHAQASAGWDSGTAPF